MHTSNPPSFPRRRESSEEGRGKSWQSFENHGNHGSNFLAIFPQKHQYVCIIKSEDFRQSRADECGHLSSRRATGNKRQVMRQQHIRSDCTGTRKGDPDPSRVRSNDLWRRPSTELKPVATPSGSVRNDRCNKCRSPRANAPSATRASRHSRCTPASRHSRARGCGAERTQGMPAKGPGKRSWIRQTSDA